MNGLQQMMGISYLRNYPNHGARWLVGVLLLGCTVQSGASAAAEVGILQRGQQFELLFALAILC